MSNMPSTVTTFHLFLEYDHGHSKIQIAFTKPVEQGGGLVVLELPRPFGCIFANLIAGCFRLHERIENVPTALRDRLSHDQAREMLLNCSFTEDIFGDDHKNKGH